MIIDFLTAGSGDSIWISHNKRNVVIDGGKSISTLKARYDQMPADEHIDLLVVTHIDSDHLAGVIELIKHMKEKGELNRIEHIWFNFPKKEKTDEYSVTEGNALSTNLCNIKGLCWNNNTSLLLGKPVDIGGVKLHVLAPDHDVANEYKPKAPAELGLEIADWNVELKTLVENVDDDDLDESCPNSQSIVILVECGDKKVLLSGDCTPNELHKALQSNNSINGTPLKLDLMKLPHHGSHRNVTKGVLAEVECSNFVISTNVNKKYCFPNKSTIAKLICYRGNTEETIKVYFNYQESLDILGITKEEQEKYNIKLYNRREFIF